MSAQAELLPQADTDTLAMLDRVDATLIPRERWPQTLADLVDVLTAHYRRRGREAEPAHREAIEVALVLAEYMGGRSLYLPCGESIEAALTAQRIWAEFNGRNTDELSRRYKLTRRRVEQILAEQRALRLRKLQGRLFEG